MYATYKKAIDPVTRRAFATGWLPPKPDLRDYTEKEVAKMVRKLKLPATLKPSVNPGDKEDLRQWCSPVEDQGGIGSCTAHAAVGIVEYYQIRAFDEHIDGSRLFVYKATRNLMGVTGDTGSYLRNVMGALVHCGVPPEKYWPYTDVDPDFDIEPSAFVYSVADDYEAISYFCHDPAGAGVTPKKLLDRVKIFLKARIPSMFGFYGFHSFPYTDVPGGIPYPGPDEWAEWGHAIVAVGYDDTKKIKNTLTGKSTTGALLIRNSWGADWGDGGYGWLPYQYILSGLASDFWSLLSMDWVNTKKFGF
ncbi:MAG TPA: C1 family peptidase [Acidobacteriota bacterium]|nr:C1 family peptidase [Acidobacteriota bacterium]